MRHAHRGEILRRKSGNVGVCTSDGLAHGFAAWTPGNAPSRIPAQPVRIVLQHRELAPAERTEVDFVELRCDPHRKPTAVGKLRNRLARAGTRARVQ
jgi:hypothetical protein